MSGGQIFLWRCFRLGWERNRQGQQVGRHPACMRLFRVEDVEAVVALVQLALAAEGAQFVAQPQVCSGKRLLPFASLLRRRRARRSSASRDRSRLACRVTGDGCEAQRECAAGRSHRSAQGTPWPSRYAPGGSTRQRVRPQLQTRRGTHRTPPGRAGTKVWMRRSIGVSAGSRHASCRGFRSA